jgi:hypothetical protein
VKSYTTSLAITVKFKSRHNAQQLNLTTVYGPCHDEQRDQCVQWLYDLHIDLEDKWIIVGDFKFYRSPDDRNRDGGNYNDMDIFNALISHLGLVEIPLKDRNYTWSNMKEFSLLWCFTSLTWSTCYPNTLLLPMAKPLSDHIPCTVQIGTTIPKAYVFRFENVWFQHRGFLDLVQATRDTQVKSTSSTARIAAKFKILR